MSSAEPHSKVGNEGVLGLSGAVGHEDSPPEKLKPSRIPGAAAFGFLGGVWGVFEGFGGLGFQA